MPEPSRFEISRAGICLGEAADHCHEIRVCCPACGHKGRANPKALLSRWHRDTPMAELTPHCRCTSCDVRAGWFEYWFKGYVVARR